MAVSCGQGMRDVTVDLCISSPLLRASETAELVLHENREYADRSERTIVSLEGEFPGKKDGKCAAGSVRLVQADGFRYYTDDRLKEASFGPWEGLICKAEGYSVPLEDFSIYWNDPDSPLIQDGVERLTQVAKRVEASLREIMAVPTLKDKTVLLVVHGCVMRSCMYLMSGRTAFRGKVPFNCEIIETEPDGNGGLTELARHIYYDRSMMHDYYATMKQE